LAAEHRGHTLRDGRLNRQALALRLAPLALEVFFFGTAIVARWVRGLVEVVVARWNSAKRTGRAYPHPAPIRNCVGNPHLAWLIDAVSGEGREITRRR